MHDRVGRKIYPLALSARIAQLLRSKLGMRIRFQYVVEANFYGDAGRAIVGGRISKATANA